MTHPRSPGRPRGRTAQGEATRRALYEAAIRRFDTDGYAAATLRDIARDAGVSPGLLYRYFPSKLAVVMALYDELSVTFEGQASLPEGAWPTRFLEALNQSLGVLLPHRTTLCGVLGVMLGDRSHGLLSPEAASSRRRVQAVFVEAVAGSTGAPAGAEALGRVLYLLHLGVVLWWLLDRSAEQRATAGLLDLLAGFAPLCAPLLWFPGVTPAVASLDALAEEGLYGGVR